jgi:hypothetical protein
MSSRSCMRWGSLRRRIGRDDVGAEPAPGDMTIRLIVKKTTCPPYTRVCEASWTRTLIQILSLPTGPR